MPLYKNYNLPNRHNQVYYLAKLLAFGVCVVYVCETIATYAHLSRARRNSTQTAHSDAQA